MGHVYNIPVENGKYNVVLTERYEVKFLRDGEEWVNQPLGSKMLIALMGQHEDLQKENIRLKQLVEQKNFSIDLIGEQKIERDKKIKQLREALQQACNSLGADVEDYLSE